MASEEQGEGQQGEQEPRDALNLGYVIFFLLGAGVLLPWNTFITAVDYFAMLYGADSHIDRIFSVSYMFPAFSLLLLLAFAPGCLRLLGAQLRINLGLSLYLAMMLLIPVMDAAVTPSSATRAATVAATAVTGLADALVQGSLVGSAGELPPRYMQALVAGTAASGVLASLLRIITKAALPASPTGLRQSANLYFLCSVVFMVICLVSYNLLTTLPVIRYHLKLHKSGRLLLLQEDAQAEDAQAQAEADGEKASFGEVWQQTRWLLLALGLLYVVTLSIFPGAITEDVQSEKLGDWYPVLLIACYNVCDLVGKAWTAAYLVHSSPLLVWASVARLLFLPALALCAHGPSILATELPVFLLTTFLGLTNGYLTSAIMIRVPKLVAPRNAETAGLMCVVSLMAGLTLGSAVGWSWVL